MMKEMVFTGLVMLDFEDGVLWGRVICEIISIFGNICFHLVISFFGAFNF